MAASVQSGRVPDVLIVDNYDSFTRNLTALIADCGASSVIVKNDRLDGGDVRLPRKVLISPGPGVPSDAGRTCDFIREFAPTKSILGICLGHQAIAEVFGGRLVRLPAPDHGVSRVVTVTGDGWRLFRGVPARFEAGFYHSWGVSPDPIPESLVVTAVSDDGAVAALSHSRYDVHGLQFHPESVMTPHGRAIIANWLAGP